jgi:hypothetical protein
VNDLNYKKLLLVSIIANLVLVLVVLVFVTKIDQKEQNIYEGIELSMLQSYVKHQEFVKESLRKSMNENEIIVEELVTAISHNYTTIFLSRYLPVPANLDLFHTSLHGYLYQMVRDIEGGSEQNHLIEQVEILVNMFSEYEKAQGFTYSDSAAIILEKLKRGEDEVITPFFYSEENPMFSN